MPVLITNRTRYYVTGRALYRAQFEFHENSLNRIIGTEELLGEFESAAVAQEVLLKYLQEENLISESRPRIINRYS